MEIAVLIPCYNEAQTILQVIQAFRAELPQAAIYVFDNNSTDNTAARAQAAGALVRTELRQGKGHVIRRMFCDIEADIYVLVDGDHTYHAPSVHRLILALQQQKLDMVVGARKALSKQCYRVGHQWGNGLFNWVIRCLFGQQFQDIFSGYRIFSRRFVKSFPCLSGGFEIETEMSIHALEMQVPVLELETPYGSRPAGSVSKLNTYRDGLKILITIVLLFKQVKPFALFFSLALLLAISALMLFMPILSTYVQSGLVPRLPTALLITSFMILSCISFFSGIILDNVSRARLETKRLFYLSYRG